MRAALFNGPHDIGVGERRDPTIQEPTDAVVRVVLSCVCGSDLWYWRGETAHDQGPIGHEFIGVIEETGAAVTGLRSGDLVVAPFVFCDGTCENCRAGVTSQCIHAYVPGSGGRDGGQAEAVRVPMASTSLVPVPGAAHPEAVLRALLTLSDVMCTGHHAAVSAGVAAGGVVAVVGDGAVGLCAVIAAKRLGAERIVALSRNPKRQAMAREFGATDILQERGDEAVARVKEMTDGVGVDAALECVGTGQSLETAMAIARPGSIVGIVGAPHHMDFPVVDRVVYGNIGLRGGIAPARAYIPELLPDVLEGRINPGRVFDYETDLEDISDAYAAMDERRAIKSLVHVSAP